MATYFYQSNPNSTKQAWLASRKICERCDESMPKGEFRMVGGLEVCKDCYADLCETASQLDAR